MRKATTIGVLFKSTLYKSIAIMIRVKNLVIKNE